MDNIQFVIDALDYSLNTPRKRHLVGGILMSVSLLLGGLALTSFTLKDKYEEDDNGRN